LNTLFDKALLVDAFNSRERLQWIAGTMSLGGVTFFFFFEFNAF
jgi:hypothetical protein